VEGTASVKLFGREPALIGAFLQATLALVLGLGVIPGLDNGTAGLISAAGAAVFGAYVAFAVKQNLLPAVIAAFQALLAVGFGFGLDFLTTDLTGLITAVVAAALGIFLRTQADPKAGSPAAPTEILVTYPETEPDDVGAGEVEDGDEEYTRYLPADGLVFSGSLEDEEDVQLR
jgi:hypothetical protein